MGKKFSTEQLADFLKVKAATIRRGLCVDGHYMQLRPLKLPNGRLLWDQDQVERLLTGEGVR